MRTIDADELLRRYDEEHEGPPGKARKLIEKAPTIGGWISVKERLPDISGEYLVAVKGYGYQKITTLAFTQNLHKLDPYTFPGKKNCIPGWYWYDSEYGYVDDDRVTHWQELPEPPKEETDESTTH